MSVEAEKYRAPAKEREEPQQSSTASDKVFGGTVWPLTVLAIAMLATLAWSIFLGGMLVRIARQLIS